MYILDSGYQEPKAILSEQIAVEIISFLVVIFLIIIKKNLD